MDWKNRIYCGELRADQVGQTVLLMGWVDAIRDHGHVVFTHIRDIRGIVQVVFQLENDRTDTKAHQLHEEYVVQISGQVVARQPGTENPNLETGAVEVIAKELTILAGSRTLPFSISEKAMVFGEEVSASPEHVDEELRLQYRYLDLRRPSIQEHFIKRHQISKCVREYLDSENFLELETPVLTKSTPEGARDYLVPSRVHPGEFYALPQSPQLFKQLFMMSGMDRYYQIVRCFRDEDLRPNRQPEFTQLDLEASFIDEEFIYEKLEELTARMFRVGGIELPRPFPRMEFDKAMNRYGSDKPDLRFGMTFEDVSDLVAHTRYTIFNKIVQGGGHVKGFCIKGQADTLSKNVLQNEYAIKIAPSFGAKGMSWMKINNGKLESNIVQFFSDEEQTGLINTFGAKDGDVLILIADSSLSHVNTVLGRLRLDFGNRLGLMATDTFCPLWVTNFPMFEEVDGRLNSMHHPFTMPDHDDFDPQDSQSLLQLKSRAYDLVMNGEELGGGSIRIHRMEVQEKVFQALGLSADEIDAKFGFFIKAMQFGPPPHGGLALGMDRVVAMILQLPSIRDVIAFPKNRSAACPMTQAPSSVDKAQLDELQLTAETIQKQQSGAGKSKTKTNAAAEKITQEQVLHVAKLARLKLAENEVAAYQQDLNAILEYVDVLSELDTENVEPMHHVLKIKNVWRDDINLTKKQPEDILKNAPDRNGNTFRVPKIIEG